jgi:hypothetical protein
LWILLLLAKLIGTLFVAAKASHALLPQSKGRAVAMIPSFKIW